MRIRPPGDPVADPFFAALRRRHPDADLVLLPAQPPPSEADPVAEQTLAGLRERVAARSAEVWRLLAPDDAAPPVAALGYGADASGVRVVARGVTQHPDAPDGADAQAELSRVRAELERLGWAVRRRSGPVERLVGVHDDLELSITCARSSGVVVLLLASRSQPVGADRARALVRAARRR